MCDFDPLQVEAWIEDLDTARAEVERLTKENEAEKYIKERRDILDNQDWGKNKKVKKRLFKLDHLIDGLKPPRGISYKELDHMRLI